MAADDEKRQWVERVLGIVMPQQGDANPDPFAAMYQDLAQTVQSDLQRLRSENSAAAETIAQIVNAAEQSAAKGDFETAFGYLNRATDALAQVAKTGRVGDAVASIPVGTVAEMVARLERAERTWSGVINTARASADAAYKELEEYFPETAAGFQRVIDSYWEDMQTAIAEAKGASDADINNLRQTMTGLRDEMSSDNLLSFLDSNGIALRPVFFTAFDEVEDLLQA